jgi:prolyl oligopeptidase
LSIRRGRLALRSFVYVTLLLAVLGNGPAPAPQTSAPSAPATPKHPVVDEYHGVKVTDDYRWLENAADPAVKQWSGAQNQRSREYLDSLPVRARVKERLQEMYAGGSSKYYELQYRQGQLYALKWQPPRQQAMLVTLRSANDLGSERVIVDPNALNDKGTTTIDFYEPSLDGKLAVVSLSEGGTEEGTGRVFDVTTGKDLSDRVPRIHSATAGGSVAWKGDGSGFYYTRYPQGSEHPKEDADFYQQIYFHKLGTDARQDTYVLGKDFPRIAEIMLQTDPAGKYLLATVANGDGGQYVHYVMDAASGRWTQISRYDDQISEAHLGPDGFLYLTSRKDAPRGKVLRVKVAGVTQTSLREAETVVPESGGRDAKAEERTSIMSMVPAEGRLFVLDIAGGPMQVRVFATGEGAGGVRELAKLGIPPVSSVSQLTATDGGNALFQVAGYLTPAAWYEYDAKSGATSETKMVTLSPTTFADAEVVREFAVSRDGTRVPVSIIQKKGTKLDGTNPTLLEGYGGYGVSLSPMFMGPFGRTWLDAGGVFAIANLRGGGEYGLEWHTEGMLTKKQNVFDDFIACAQHLIATKYTSPEHLAIIGGSNGGLLMGAAFTQHPEMFRAVVSFVGIYDMLRVELAPNGSFNVTEFGTVKDEDQFKALFAYSPYHHVKDGTAYPAILFLTGDNDGRVDPMQSRKMTARLQAAGSAYPVLLRTSSNSGHGMGTSLNEMIEQDADFFAFLFDQLGMEYRPKSMARGQGARPVLAMDDSPARRTKDSLRR